MHVVDCGTLSLWTLSAPSVTSTRVTGMFEGGRCSRHSQAYPARIYVSVQETMQTVLLLVSGNSTRLVHLARSGFKKQTSVESSSKDSLHHIDLDPLRNSTSRRSANCSSVIFFEWRDLRPSSNA